MKGVALLLSGFLLTGCTYNSSPLHLNMRHAEFRREMAERFCLGMSVDEVLAELDLARLRYRRVPIAPGTSPGSMHIEAALEKSGASLRGVAAVSGRVHFWFEGDRLARVDYQHPWAPDSYELTAPIAVEVDDCGGRSRAGEP